MMQFAFSAVGIISNSPIVKQTFDLSLISLTILGRNKRLLSTRILKPCGLYNVPRFQSLANVCSACIFRRSASQCLLMHSNKISNLWIGTFRSIKMKIFRLSEHTVYRLRLLRNANITLCSGISLLVLGELWFMICQCSIVFCSEFNTKNHLFHECYDQESRKQNAPFPWNKLFHLLWQDIWYLILTIMCAIGAAVASIQIPIMLGDMTNIVCKFSSKTISNFFDDIRKPALKLLSVYIAQAALTFAYISVLSSVGERLAARLRSQLFSAYLHRDMAFFDSHKTGELIDRLTSDVQDFKSSFKMCVSQGLKAATQTIGCAVSLVCISPKLSVVMLVIIPTFIGGGAVLGGFLRQLSRKAQEQVGQSAAVANEAIGNIRTVRAFAMEEREMHGTRGSLPLANVPSVESRPHGSDVFLQWTLPSLCSCHDIVGKFDNDMYHIWSEDVESTTSMALVPGGSG